MPKKVINISPVNITNELKSLTPIVKILKIRMAAKPDIKMMMLHIAYLVSDLLKAEIDQNNAISK